MTTGLGQRGDIAVPMVAAAIHIAGVDLAPDPDGVLYWPDERALIVADLHLEKGSSYAARGVLIPPYDSAATLGRLARLIARYAPRLVITLGDNFHDGGGPLRLSDRDRDTLFAFQRGRDFVWIAGNHDPDPAPALGGQFVEELAIGPLVFRHQANGTDQGEITGHLHPAARIIRRGRSVRRRCFVGNGERLVMPAFGAYTGGLNVRDRAFTEVFAALDFTAHLLGAGRLYPIAAAHCLAD